MSFLFHLCVFESFWPWAGSGDCPWFFPYCLSCRGHCSVIYWFSIGRSSQRLIHQKYNRRMSEKSWHQSPVSSALKIRNNVLQFLEDRISGIGRETNEWFGRHRLYRRTKVNSPIGSHQWTRVFPGWVLLYCLQSKPGLWICGSSAFGHAAAQGNSWDSRGLGFCPAYCPGVVWFSLWTDTL